MGWDGWGFTLHNASLESPVENHIHTSLISMDKSVSQSASQSVNQSINREVDDG
jgi:hypothetical protein